MIVAAAWQVGPQWESGVSVTGMFRVWPAVVMGADVQGSCLEVKERAKKNVVNRVRRGIVLVVAVIASCGEGSDHPDTVPEAEVPDPAEASPAPEPGTAPGVSDSDEFFDQQWHLVNTGQNFGRAGEDIRVADVWNRGVFGDSVVVAIVDDGIEVAHEDLFQNMLPGRSFDYLDGDRDPTPPTDGWMESFAHGTAVAGVIAARDRNGVGVRGVAPRARLVGFNATLPGLSTDENIADALTRSRDVVDISNNSWSNDPDGTGELYARDAYWELAIQTGIETGRNGKGINYVWAAGNGGATGVDNANFDGMANDRRVIAVCAVGDDGRKARYSEEGANLWVCAPSWGGWRLTSGITTTDRSGAGEGYNQAQTFDDYGNRNYTRRFGGTSAATPVVSGVVALMLDVNPSLSWRDVRLILAQTARRNHPEDNDWTVTRGTPVYHINHKYGFGVVDAAAAVALAEDWSTVGPLQVVESPWSLPARTIPDNDARGVSDTITVVEDLTIEYVEVVFDAPDHTDIGDLAIVLIAPSGTRSRLAQARQCRDPGGVVQDRCRSRYDRWVFGVARHLGERSRGVWTLQVTDIDAGETGVFAAWRLRIYGRRDDTG